MVERVRGIEPLSAGWKPAVIATIRHPRISKVSVSYLFIGDFARGWVTFFIQNPDRCQGEVGAFLRCSDQVFRRNEFVGAWFYACKAACAVPDSLGVVELRQEFFNGEVEERVCVHERGHLCALRVSCSELGSVWRIDAPMAGADDGR